MFKEADLLRFTIDALKHSGLVWWRVSNGPSIYTVNKKIAFRKSHIAGFPDLAGITNTGLFWALELKTTKGRLSENQKVWIDRLEKSGATVVVARSTSEVLNFIYALKKIKPHADAQGFHKREEQL
jgi:hypothetical protein